MAHMDYQQEVTYGFCPISVVTVLNDSM